jgi:RHH-type proline utilization regulon transcriptional repressor/proline dehydrogenase/delta 1-pyrroline-5-carboxylate dehydrogenase
VVAQVTKPDYETKTLAIANALLMATREKKNLFAQMRDQMRWDDKIMDFAMGNPGLKVQLFRFIDALPALRSKPEIARHLQEYLSAEEVELPGVLKGIAQLYRCPTRPQASSPPPPLPPPWKPWPTATFPPKPSTRR